MVSEAKIVISVLGLEDPAQKVGELSGGQRKRVARGTPSPPPPHPGMSGWLTWMDMVG